MVSINSFVFHMLGWLNFSHNGFTHKKGLKCEDGHDVKLYVVITVYLYLYFDFPWAHVHVCHQTLLCSHLNLLFLVCRYY